MEDVTPVVTTPEVSSVKSRLCIAVCGAFVFVFLILAIVAASGGVESPDVSYPSLTSDDRTVKLPLDALFVALAAGFYALGIVAYFTHAILASPLMDEGDAHGERMYEISKDIKDGAKSFLTTEYKYISVFVGVVAALLVATGYKTSICFFLGAVTSAACGWIGMDLATSANVRTTYQARQSLSSALKLAFRAGTVMGLSVVGLGLGVLALVFVLFQSVEYVAGFGFGASAIALFARVGGGIFTKAADVGADLVGKVEEDIPEDDPRNPGVIADNVGDNVGDVAGMGADLFESYVGSIIASVALGKELVDQELANKAVAAPFYLAAAGIVCSVVGAVMVKTTETTQSEGIMNRLLWAIRKGIFIAAGLNAVAGLAILSLLGLGWQTALSYIIGLVAGILIGISTEYYTSFEYKPTKEISKSGLTGPATVIISGLSVGMYSCIFPCLIMFASILSCVSLGKNKFGEGGEYCIAVAAVGMLSTLGVTLATDAYGPVADNAGGIAEMAGLPEEVREITDALDALGNTTAATGKGFAIGSAVLTAMALLKAFATVARVQSADVLDSSVLSGLLIGVLLPYIFASMTMTAVGDSAQDIIVEVRRQFREIPGLREGEAGVRADHKKCVEIATKGALKKMVAPGCLAVVTPIIFGFLFGPVMLIGLLAGAILSGFMLAVTMANAGGAWDNAKKYVEAAKLKDDEGNVHKKGSELHKAVVVGDTVGDPFKDTSGPALNILIKLMSVISLVLAPSICSIHCPK